jgi:uncharacterized membrane protein YgdD (TMEM256/DUF423 family)
MNKKLILTGLFWHIAIILGAFGAHALKLLPEQLITFETGYAIKCTMLCFLILIALLNDLSEKQKNLLFSRFGVILFSLSIYLLATNNLTSFDFKVIGFVTLSVDSY